jgi:hypothetical protein
VTSQHDLSREAGLAPHLASTRTIKVPETGARLLEIYDNPGNPKVRVTLVGPRGGYLASVDLRREDLLGLGRALVTQYQPEDDSRGTTRG